MPLEEDVLSIGKTLEKLVDQGQSDNETAMDMLKQLKSIPITLDVLQKTRIGIFVNVLRKASTKDDIQSLAKTLIKTWKKLLDNQEKSKVQRSTSQDKSNSPNLQRSQLIESDSSSSSQSVAGGKHDSKSSQNSKDTFSVVSFPPVRGDVAVRQKCREMLKNSLKCDDKAEYDGTEVAAKIEEAVFTEFNGDTGIKYKNRIKSRVMNLRDKNNPLLKLKVIFGDISPDKFAVMKPEELASENMKKMRDQFTQQAINDHQLSVVMGTGTDQFKCGKCGKRKCTYNQVQTRSADEPMTTFVLCMECGNRWKFC